MAGVAEKARFYLERSVPKLREWEEKEIFSKDEIRTIVQKRNDFEHRVLSPGNKASEWSSFAKWERTLEKLRNKRCQRLKIRHLESAHAGQGRVIAIYERAVNRHPASGELWREYLDYAAGVRASKRWQRTMTSALRMSPTDAGLWAMAGRRSARNGDMAAARSFFMRGCRFCSKDCSLWIEYARCEMEWLAKVDKRKKIKPSADPLLPDRIKDNGGLVVENSDEESDAEGVGNNQQLPEPSAAQNDVINPQVSQQLASNPAMDGAIPIAIFDVARKQPFFNPDVAESFFVMLAAFRHVSVQPRVWQHVLDAMDEQFPQHASTCNCHVRQPILGLDPHTAEFARNLRDVLSRLGERLETTTDRGALEQKTTAWIDGYLLVEGLDAAIQKVLELTKAKLVSSSAT